MNGGTYMNTEEKYELIEVEEENFMEKVKDFLNKKESGFDDKMTKVQSSYKPNICFADFGTIVVFYYC